MFSSYCDFFLCVILLAFIPLNWIREESAVTVVVSSYWDFGVLVELALSGYGCLMQWY